jgi:hypothetical protein
LSAPPSSAGFPGVLISTVDGVSYSRQVSCYHRSADPVLVASPLGLVGQWLFDGGTVGAQAPLSAGGIGDSSGLANHGTADNSGTGIIFQAGQHGTGLRFDNVDDLIRVPAAPSINNLPGVTVSVWLRPVTAPVTQYGRTIFSKGEYNTQATPQSVGWRFSIENSDTLPYFWAGFGDNGLEFGSQVAPFALGSWSHLAVTWDGGNNAANIHMYLNGFEIPGEPGYMVSGTGTRPDDSGKFLGISGPIAGPFGGEMDEPMLFNRPLSAHEIQALFVHGPAGIQ